MGRQRIGLIYQPTSNWIAGAYYVQNIICALNTCEDKNKPLIYLYTSSFECFNELRRFTCYPYLKFRKINDSESKIQNLFRRIIKKILNINFEFHKPPFLGDRVKFVYPIQHLELVRNKTKALGWIPDFQEKYFPNLFSKNDVYGRDASHKSFIMNGVPVVFSSNDTLCDFRRFYPEGVNLKSFVLPFAVTHPDYSNVSIEQLKIKYSIKKSYLFCANQFWMHKNHMFLFDAFAEALSRGLDLQLVCSGKMFDYRNDVYGQTISSFIHKNNLENDILLLGYIDRSEQLCLMKNSYALIQPSLFEGWSTVVEDAKCLNKFIFLSDLPVHREQAPLNVCYFNPNDKLGLVDKLLQTNIIVQYYNYDIDVRRFGDTFIDIINYL